MPCAAGMGSPLAEGEHSEARENVPLGGSAERQAGTALLALCGRRYATRFLESRKRPGAEEAAGSALLAETPRRLP